jgi:hypothetical protein
MTRGQILSERIKLMAQRLVEEEMPDLDIIANNNAARGMSSSGATVVQRHERRFRTLDELLRERTRSEREYPLAPEDEDQWYANLMETLLLILHDQEERLYRALEADCQRFLGAKSEPFVAEEKINRLRFNYLHEAEIMKAEREHRKKIPPPATASPNITLTISGGQIAALNVGGVVGTIKASLTSLQSAGEQKLAEALKSLAEAIAADASLSTAAKRESLECVSAMGEELAKPTSERRPGVVRAMGAGLIGLIGHADKVYAVYEILKVAAKASGYELP